MTIRIFSDAGHGGSDSGATGNGLLEKDVTLKLSKYFAEILTQDYKGVVVKQSRTDDRFLSLSARADKANDWGADYFISFHINAFNGSANGFESFIYNGSVSNNTKKYQDIMHEEIMKVNDLSDRGQKRANFAVVRETAMPAILTENGFIDNKHDAKKLKDNDYLYKVAKAHAKGVARIFNLKKENDQTDDTTQQEGKLHEVIAGTFSRYTNAKKQESIVKDKGFEAYVKTSGKYYEVIAGTFKDRENARNRSESLENHGIETYIK